MNEITATAEAVANAIRKTDSAGNGDCFLAALAMRELLSGEDVIRIVGRCNSHQHEWAAIEDEDGELVHIDPTCWAMDSDGGVTVATELPEIYSDWYVEDWDESLADEFSDELAALVRSAR